MKANHNNVEKGGYSARVVTNIMKSKNESKSQPERPYSEQCQSCNKYHEIKE